MRSTTVLLLAFVAAGCANQNDTSSASASRHRGADRPEVATIKGVGASDSLPQARSAGQLETVAIFSNSMPTGVTVSRRGRVFVNFPRWGDPVPFTVAEIRNGEPIAFPNDAINRLNTNRALDTFVSVQSVVVDPHDRLWVLDTGSIEMQPIIAGGPKLVGIDLATDRVMNSISFPTNVVLPTTYLNDVRFDLRKGSEGIAYITDSSDKGPNGIIVVDLGSGRSWRRLHDHPSTKAEPNFLAFVEGRALLRQKAGQAPELIRIGSDGIAISADGSRLYFCPLASRRLFSVSADALSNESATEDQVAATVRDEGSKPAADGLESDSDGGIYITAYEHNAILRRSPDGTYETLVHDSRALWPDTLAVAHDAHLYFIANQLHRQPDFHRGKDLRAQPYSLFRVSNDASPVMLSRNIPAQTGRR